MLGMAGGAGGFLRSETSAWLLGFGHFIGKSTVHAAELWAYVDWTSNSLKAFAALCQR